MRKLFQARFFVLLALGASPTFAAAAQAAPASSVSGAGVTLTPEQARQALVVLNDPERRGQVTDTLQAIAAAGALSTPPASAPAAASASVAAATVPAAFQPNGLASQLARQGAHWAVSLGKSLRSSVAALLDVASVRAWWNWQSINPQARAVLGHVAWSLLASLVPALLLEWLALRSLRRAYKALAAHRVQGDEDDALQTDLPVDVAPQPADAPNAAPLLPVSPASVVTVALAKAAAAPPGTSAAACANGKVTEANGKQNAKHHWTLLQRLPRALLTLVARLFPLVVFVGAASALMSICTDVSTPQVRALDSLVDIYVLCRVIVIVSGFFLQPSARRACACCA